MKNAGWFDIDVESGDYVRNNPDGSQEWVHPDLNGAEPDHYDYSKRYPGQPGVDAGKIYSCQNGQGIYVPNPPKPKP